MSEELQGENVSEVAEPTEQVESQEQVEQESVTTEEVAEPQHEKSVQDAETNAMFAKVRREAEQKAAQKAKDDMIAEMYGESHGIYTYADYQLVLQRQKWQEEGKDPEVQEKLQSLENKVNTYERLITNAEQKSALKDQPFFNEWANDVEVMADKIGSDLDVAYTIKLREEMPNIIKSYEDKIAQLETKVQAYETNSKNAATSPGSVTGNGPSGSDFISLETFEANKHDSAWVMRNFSKINESRANW